MEVTEERLNAITEQILGAAFAVSNTLGVGFLEKVYENALAHELRKRGLKVEQQFCIQVYYDSVVVGEYAVDLMVEDLVCVELKVAKGLDSIHEAICLNYLKASQRSVGLLLNFGKPRLEYKRFRI